MIVDRAYVPASGVHGRWPFTIPAVAEVARSGLSFERPVTFLVGENGSGKSTLVEAIAEAYGLDARGGRTGRKYGNQRPRTELGELLRLDLTVAGARMGRRGYFHRAETAFGFMGAVSGLPGYWAENTDTMSHGEGFFTVFDAMFRERGFYVLDEPEAALSFSSCLRLVALMHELGRSGAQVVCATHSPVLAATPDADVVEVGDDGLRRIPWNELALVDHWRRYLNAPGSYLRHITSADE